MKRINFLDITPNMFDDIKGKEVSVLFYENGTIVKTVKGNVTQINRSAPIACKMETSLLESIVLDDKQSVTVREALEFIDSSSSKQVFIEYK